MKIVTFNIRCDYGQDGANEFQFRREMIREKLMAEKPDVVCFQEVLPHVAAWLKDNLADYNVLGCGREKQLDGEQTTVAFLKMKYQMLSMNTFWLSETPFVPASRYEHQSTCPRTCTEVLLHDLEEGSMFRIYNTHLDHEGSGARVSGMQQILNYAKKRELFPNVTSILTGDFNALPSDPEIILCSQSEDWVDLTEGMEGTFHDFGKEAVPEKIDYIMATPTVKCLKRELWKDEKHGVFLSDHYPVCVEITI